MGIEREQVLKPLVNLVQAIRAYHSHEVIGMQHLPTRGRVLVVVNHSLATYDIILLMMAIYTELGRIPRPLADRLFFKIPYLGKLVKAFGAIQGTPEGAKKLLEADELVTVAPGGMREALRPSNQRYQICWERRYGFAKLAIATGTPIVLAACPRADDLYDVYPSMITKWFYRHLRVPIFLAKGIGLTPLPKPTKLLHLLSEPIYPPVVSKRASPKTADKHVKQFHAELTQRMNALMREAVQYPVPLLT